MYRRKEEGKKDKSRKKGRLTGGLKRDNKSERWTDGPTDRV